MRLDRFLSNNLNISRKQAARLIKDGLVQVDGSPASNAAQALSEQTRVFAQGRPVVALQPLYLLLHKPAGYLCATTDGTHPTVMDLLPESIHHQYRDIQIVGRLDLDTTGLVLMTTDGQWNHHVTSPRRPCSKTYRATLAEALERADIERLEAGVLLKGESKPTLPCSIQPVTERIFDITLNEGRYHQVKRMFAAVGNRVTALHRWRVGSITLNDLAEGEHRLLSADEAAAV